jgi:carboxyl-terminal processing protease
MHQLERHPIALTPVRLRARVLRRGLSLLLAALLVAQSGATAGASQPIATAGPPADIDHQVGVVRTAYDLMLDRFVHPLDSAALLRAAWDGVDHAAADHSARRPGSLPTLSGERAADFAAFEAALREYVAAQPTLPADVLAAHAAVRAMAALADEQHTYFMSPPEYRDYLEWVSGGAYAGLGVRLGLPEMVIREVYPDSPAAQAGLRAGDQLVRVDGRPLAGLDREHASGLIRGPEGSVAELVVRRPTEADDWLVWVPRRPIVVPQLSADWLDDATAYLRLRSFPEGTTIDQVEQALVDFEQHGACGLVLDLRGNVGGRLEVGARLLSHFLPPGAPVLERIDRSGGDRTWVAEAGWPFGRPLVVLVDDGTASMGELFAAAIQDNHVGMIIGSRTAGNVAGGMAFPLGDGSGLAVTVLDIHSAAGRTLNRVGVAPDRAATDSVLEQARSLLPIAGC